jgi:hypothetical protein
LAKVWIFDEMWREKLILKEGQKACEFHSRCRRDLNVNKEAACFYEIFPEFQKYCTRLERYEERKRCESSGDGLEELYYSSSSR